LLRFIWAKKMLLLVVIVTVLTPSLTGCIVGMYNGTQPPDYINSMWICDEPYIVYEVTDSDRTAAYIGKGDEKVAIEMGFLPGGDIEVVYDGETYINDETLLFRGECILKMDRFIIVLTEDNYWDGEYDRLVFKRVK